MLHGSRGASSKATIVVIFVVYLVLQVSPVKGLNNGMSTAAGSNSDLGGILKTTFPHLVSFESTTTITQANAEGQRLILTLHEDDDPYDHPVFVKRVAVSDYIDCKKDWPDLRRTLLYARTEIRFYQEVLPKLQANFQQPIAPKIYRAQHSLDEFIPDSESGLSPAGAPPPIYQTYKSDPNPSSVEGMTGEIIMDCVNDDNYLQASPISIDQAKQCLTAVAQLHAAAWQNEEMLKLCSDRLSLASFHLDTRNPKELAGMEASWEHFSTQFQSALKEAGLLERTKDLGKRLKAAAKAISLELSPQYNGKYATLVHGDYKAFNVFLPKDLESDHKPLLVDFASTGIGLGVSDVAMLVHHAVLPENLANGGEEELVDHYLQTLQELLPEGQTYPRDVALRQYRLGVCDYGRFVAGRFWKTATPETFEKRKDSPNTTLINRNVAAAMAFIDRMERYLAEFEKDQAVKTEL